MSLLSWFSLVSLSVSSFSSELDSTLRPRTLIHHLGERKQLKQILAANCIFSRFNLIVYTWKFRVHLSFFFVFLPLWRNGTHSWVLSSPESFTYSQFWHNVNLAAITRLVRVRRNFPRNTVESSLTVRPLLLLHTQEQGWMRTSNVFHIYVSWKNIEPASPWLMHPSICFHAASSLTAHVSSRNETDLTVILTDAWQPCDNLRCVSGGDYAGIGCFCLLPTSDRRLLPCL